jgi:TonB family protein
MRSLTVLALTLTLTLAVPAKAVPQDVAACAFDTAAHTRLDTLILGLTPARRELSREMRADYLRAAEAIREQFDRPAVLRLPFAVRVVDPKSRQPRSSFAPFGLHGFVRFQLDTTGRLKSDAVMVSSASPDIVESVVAAIQQADSAYAFPPTSKSVRRENGEIMLRFVDTVRTKEPSVALLRLIIPAVVSDARPSVLSFPRLEYPPNLQRERVTGRVLLEFIVGTDGLMEPGSLQLLESPRSEFMDQALEGLKSARFRPAKIGSCAVPSLVRLPVDFKMRTSITGTVQSRP